MPAPATLLASLGLAMSLAACSNHPAAPPVSSSAPAAARADDHAEIAGVWTRRLDNGEDYQLKLFASGIVAFQHYGKLPISRSYGHWTYASGHLAFAIAASEPDGHTFPLPIQVAAEVAAGGHTLILTGGTERSEWQLVTAPYGPDPGGAERATRDERDWIYSVQRAGG
jgi:hypothetical protein